MWFNQELFYTNDSFSRKLIAFNFASSLRRRELYATLNHKNYKINVKFIMEKTRIY
jgi:hypothetical protein